MPPQPDHLLVFPFLFAIVVLSDKIIYAIEWVLL